MSPMHLNGEIGKMALNGGNLLRVGKRTMFKFVKIISTMGLSKPNFIKK